jgi:hypothetical protein
VATLPPCSANSKCCAQPRCVGCALVVARQLHCHQASALRPGLLRTGQPQPLAGGAPRLTCKRHAWPLVPPSACSCGAARVPVGTAVCGMPAPRHVASRGMHVCCACTTPLHYTPALHPCITPLHSCCCSPWVPWPACCGAQQAPVLLASTRMQQAPGVLLTATGTAALRQGLQLIGDMRQHEHVPEACVGGEKVAQVSQLVLGVPGSSARK